MVRNNIFTFKDLSRNIDENIQHNHIDNKTDLDINKPDIIYKYYGNIQYAFDVIENQRIHMDNPVDYNDPYDASCFLNEKDFYYITDLWRTIDAIIKISTKNMISDTHAINNAFSEYTKQKNNPIQLNLGECIDYICHKVPEVSKHELCVNICEMFQYRGRYTATRYKVSCFSESNSSLLMWAYYTHNYQGVCLGFHVDDDLELKNKLHKVIYSDTLSQGVTSENLVLSKSTEWEHEKEWRVVSLEKNDYMATSSLRDIIIGFRIKKEEFARLIELARRHNLNVYRIGLSKEKYELIIEKMPI